ALVMSIYLIYVVTTLWRSHNEYQHRLDIDQQLRDQRDLFEQQGRVDALTELANRRFFTESLMQMSQNAKGSDSKLVLLVLDLDYFKNINDQHGHAVGDSCLAIFASRLKTKFGFDGEHAARLGGEEFGVLLQGHTLDLAMARAEGFRAMCVSEPIQVGGIIMPITVSIGVAAFDPDKHHDGDGLYRAADSAVYRAKNSGRNKVCSHIPDVV
ncbi:MAG: GGDEF domain-containing protein, partial [Methylococcales bacterium]